MQAWESVCVHSAALISAQTWRRQNNSSASCYTTKFLSIFRLMLFLRAGVRSCKRKQRKHEKVRNHICVCVSVCIISRLVAEEGGAMHLQLKIAIYGDWQAHTMEQDMVRGRDWGLSFSSASWVTPTDEQAIRRQSCAGGAAFDTDVMRTSHSFKTLNITDKPQNSSPGTGPGPSVSGVFTSELSQ